MAKYVWEQKHTRAGMKNRNHQIGALPCCVGAQTGVILALHFRLAAHSLCWI